MGGLWNIPSGVITKPGGASSAGLHQEVFYLPQKPYNVLGTLVDQMTYPDDSRAARDLGREELRAILAQVEPLGLVALFVVQRGRTVRGCTTAQALYTRLTKIIGASLSEATMRPNPRSTSGTSSTGRGCSSTR